MRRILLILLTSLLTRTDALQIASLPPVPAYSPPACQVAARWTGHRSMFGQYLVEITLPPACPPNAGRLARIITRHGGVLPPIGYFRLGGGYPRALRYWLLSPAYVNDRYAANDWRPVPIVGAPWAFSPLEAQ